MRKPSYSNTSNNNSNTLTTSYVSNPGKWPLMGITLGQVVDRAERLYGEREAVVSVFQGIRKNYAQLKEEVSDAMTITSTVPSG
ncbi:hypothetical protein E2C01_029497 [Portunus trituberculatus]|uniref:Uncharacterized protein n=1 Tax=Portunus trituberculatus TaxID=210409 RepID=A0A5B7EPI5_PORTR|nr:hypothetical protein [Portunus trituberculatus]